MRGAVHFVHIEKYVQTPHFYYGEFATIIEKSTNPSPKNHNQNVF